MQRCTLYGAPGSPYTCKIRALLRYRRIPFVFKNYAPGMTRAGLTEEESQELEAVRPQVIPILRLPPQPYLTTSLLVDSTPMIYRLESLNGGERGVVPPDPVAALCAHLIEDFCDEWLTKVMFWGRWEQEIDQRRASAWLAATITPGAGLERAKLERLADMFAERQVGRRALVGCTDDALMRHTLAETCAILEQHFDSGGGPFLFGSRPSIAEFGLFGQLSQLAIDSTPAEWLSAHAPRTRAWVSNFEDLSGVEGEWDTARP